jgi:hypothetical protein
MRRFYLVGFLIAAVLHVALANAQDIFTSAIPIWVLHLDNHVTITAPLKGDGPFTVEGHILDASNVEVRHFVEAHVSQSVFKTSFPPFSPGTYHLTVRIIAGDGEITVLNHFPKMTVPRR